MKAPGDMGCGREGQQARAAQRRHALHAVEPGPSVTHLRKDIGFAAAGHRPTGLEYDRYINLVIKFRDNGYRADCLYDISPFRVADIGFNAILQRGNQDLRFLLTAIGDVGGASEVATMEQKTEAGSRDAGTRRTEVDPVCATAGAAS